MSSKTVTRQENQDDLWDILAGNRDLLEDSVSILSCVKVCTDCIWICLQIIQEQKYPNALP